jgi:hypothetical protein
MTTNKDRKGGFMTEENKALEKTIIPGLTGISERGQC